MPVQIQKPPFKVVPIEATHWMSVTASEMVTMPLPTARTVYSAMLTSAPDVVIPAINAKEVERCIQESRRLAEADETMTWAQHLVLIVQQAMAQSMGAKVAEYNAKSPVRAIVL